MLKFKGTNNFLVIIAYLSICIGMAFSFISCNNINQDEPDNNRSDSTEGYRCVLEIWTEKPAMVHFWGCSWHGNLSQDGKAISGNNKITLLKDLGKYNIDSKYYRTEFVSSTKGLLTLNFRIHRTEKSGNDSFGFRYKYVFYDGDKKVSEVIEDDDDYEVGLAGFSVGAQVTSPYEL